MGNPSIGSAELLMIARPPLSSAVVLVVRVVVEMTVVAVLSAYTCSAAVSSAGTDTAIAG